jgi:hypothetical protein
MEYIGFVFPEDIPIASDLLTFIWQLVFQLLNH